MTSALGLVARLVLVFALLALVLWVLKRTGGFGAARRGGGALQVVSTARLGKSATLSVVRVHDEEYVLGVSGSSLTVVAHRPGAAPAELPVPAAAAPAVLAAPQGPPTPGEFLLDAWRVLRRRPVADTAISPDAVAVALAAARGEEPAATPLPAPAAPRLAGPAPASRFAEDLARALAATPAAPPAPTCVRPAGTPAGTPAGRGPRPATADGPAVPSPRSAPERPGTRTDASPAEEHTPWSPTARPSRTADRDAVAV